VTQRSSSLSGIARFGAAVSFFVAASTAAMAQDDFAARAKKPPALMAAFVTLGVLDPNNVIPTVDGVPGAGIDNLDIAFPLTAVAHGTVYVVQVAAQDLTYNGSCSITYELDQKQKGVNVVLDSGTINGTFACKPGTTFAVGNRTHAIPNSPGAATLTGTITYGSKTATTTLPLFIQ
jgi:hypothetical protein